MRSILLITLLSTMLLVPSYANQQVGEAIKAIEVEGIGIFSSMEQAISVLTGNGYEEISSSPRSTRFKKGGCQIEFGHMMGTSMLKYACDDLTPDVGGRFDISEALEKLCSIEDNGKQNRAGCLPADTHTSPMNIEEFVVAADGYRYVAKIWSFKDSSGAPHFNISITATKFKK